MQCKESIMNIAFFSLALASQFGSPLAVPVADVVPVINVEQTCKETAATDKAMSLDLSQSVENCMRDENAARQQLATIIPLPFVTAARPKRRMREWAAMSTC
jgi:hypothetical protein